jgi:hypothetical protein
MTMWSRGENALLVSYIIFRPVISGLFHADRQMDKQADRPDKNNFETFLLYTYQIY